MAQCGGPADLFARGAPRRSAAAPNSPALRSGKGHPWPPIFVIFTMFNMEWDRTRIWQVGPGTPGRSPGRGFNRPNRHAAQRPPARTSNPARLQDPGPLTCNASITFNPSYSGPGGAAANQPQVFGARGEGALEKPPPASIAGPRLRCTAHRLAVADPCAPRIRVGKFQGSVWAAAARACSRVCGARVRGGGGSVPAVWPRRRPRRQIAGRRPPPPCRCSKVCYKCVFDVLSMVGGPTWQCQVKPKLAGRECIAVGGRTPARLHEFQPFAGVRNLDRWLLK
jgi:hypothetical protein